MSVNFPLWLSAIDPLLGRTIDQAAERAGDAWRHIQDKPSAIVLTTPAGVALPLQTVRLEWDSRAADLESAAGRAPLRRLIIYGVHGHPSIMDTDMAEGYRFVLGDDEYRIIDTLLTLGEIQATAEATG